MNISFSSLYAAIGPAGLVLVAVACVAVYLSIRNLLYLHFVWRDFKRDFLDLEQRQDCCIPDACAASDNPLIAIVRDIVHTHGGHSEDTRAEVAYLFHRNFEGVTESLCWLRFISVVSPLLGLLGTVLGMVTVFRTIAENTAPSTGDLAAGIGEALLTTVMGLCVAIPALMVYYYLLLKFKGFHVEAVEHSYRALDMCSDIRHGDSAAQAARLAREDAPGQTELEARHV